MAENKKSFLLYTDLIHTIEKMSDEETGKLFKHILRYVNDKNPEPETTLIDLVFEPIKQSLKRDLKRYESICKRNKENGKKGGRPKTEETQNNPLGFLETQQNPKNPNKPDNDSDSDINNIYTNNLSVNWDALVDQFNEITGKKTRVVNTKTKRQFKDRLKEGYTKEDFVNAITNCSKDPFQKDNGLKYLTLEFISRADKLEKYATMNPKLTG